MAIHYVCPKCKKPMKSPDRFTGKRSGCNTELIVPEKKAVHARKERAKCGPSKKGGTKRGSEIGAETKPQSGIETGDFESEARAVLRP
jgi:hypothetical protein